MPKWREIQDELKTVVLQREGLGDALLPPILFLALRAILDWRLAASAALLAGGAITILRWRRGHRVLYALGGIGGTALAAGLALIWGRAAGFFLPGLFGALLTALVAVISVIVKRPLVALTSHVARGWPLAWYWHPQVRPAYSEITWFWAIFSLGRAWLQAQFLDDIVNLGWVSLASGWPLTILLLVLTYIYGTWRLQHLGGPSVDEFRRGDPPPWQSQQRGF